MRQVSTSTLSNQNIATALLVNTYTADADRLLFIRVCVDQVAGNGSYSAYVTLQELGTGSAYQIQPVTTATVASGVTAIAFATIALPVKNTDVVKVYVLGLAGDTTTPDIITRILEDDSLRPTTADRTLDVSSGGEAGLDWANVGSPSTTLSLSATTVATVTTTTTATNLTNAPTSGDLTATMKTSVTTAATAATPAVTVSDKTGFSLSTAGILAIWHQLTSAIVTAGTIGKLLTDNIDAVLSAVKAKTDLIPASPASTTNITGGTITTVTNLTNAPTSGDLTATMKTSVTTAATAATPIAASVTGAVGSVTGNVGGSVASVTAGVTVTTNNDKTGYSLSVTPPTAAAIRAEIDSNSTQLAKLGVPVSTIAADIAGVQSDTDDLQTRIGTAGAGLTALATATNLATANTNISAINTKLGTPAGASVSADIAAVKTDTAAIGAKTTNLPTDPADASDIAASFSSIAATLATIAAYIDTEVAAIKAKTDGLPSDPADASDVAAAVAAIQVDTNDIQARLPAALSGGKMDSVATISQLDTDSFTVALLQLIADHVRVRGAANTKASGLTVEKYSEYDLIQSLLKGTQSGSTLTPHHADGTALDFTHTLITDPSGVPVVGMS